MSGQTESAAAARAQSVAAAACRRYGPSPPMSLNDLEIARSIPLRPLSEVARILGLGPDDLEPYGTTKAKVRLDLLQKPPVRGQGVVLCLRQRLERVGVVAVRPRMVQEMVIPAPQPVIEEAGH